ncbi:MAG: hypothetical protein LBC71_03235, partial [Oscillospiraceae bacterium]|nr:hypothetical protein [Oscillospiraceae bacterium]
TLQAVTDFECIALPLYEYRTTLIRNITFINLVGKELAEKLMQRAINGAINILQPLEARLSAYIMQTAIGGVFDEQLTHVAVLLGTSYRHLLRTLEKLRLSNILEKQENTYRIVNQKTLKALSGDLYMFY